MSRGPISSQGFVVFDIKILKAHWQIFKIHLISLLILGTYEQIHLSGFFCLPHQTTLSKYAGFAIIGTEFSSDIIKRLLDDVSFEQLKTCEKHLILYLDEMKIKSGLVYSKSLGM